MTSKNIIFSIVAIGALSASANAQMANSMGTMSKPGMKATTSHTAMPSKPAAKSDAMMDKKSDAMEDKKEMKSRHHHHRMHHHHHRMMQHKM